MDYSFVRKLAKNIAVEDRSKVYQCLIANGVEVFLKKENDYFNATDECLQEYDAFYVSAADLVFARTLISEIGHETYLCSDTETNSDIKKSHVELAEEEFYRKHKQNQVLAWGLIAAVIIFMIFQFLK